MLMPFRGDQSRGARDTASLSHESQNINYRNPIPNDIPAFATIKPDIFATAFPSKDLILVPG
jgi:hypothetical protein